MKYKMTAVLVALAMMFAGVFVMADGDGADAGASTSVSINTGEIYTTQLMLNDNAYSEYTQTAAWVVGTDSVTAPSEDSAYKTLTESQTVTVDNLVFTIIKKTDGLYALTVDATSVTAAASEKAYKIACFMKLTTGTTAISLTEFDYELKITIVAKGAVTLSDITFTKGVAGTVSLTPSGAITDLSNYNWYAIGLPDGLGMSTDGKVSGVATTVNTTGTSCTVVAYEKTDAGKATSVPKYYDNISLKVVVNDVTGKDVKLMFTNGTVVGGTIEMEFKSITGESPTITPSGNVLVEEGKELTFTTDLTQDEIISVYAVDENSKVVKLTFSDSKYTLKTTGTGLYKVMIYANVGGQQAVLTFDTTVVANLHGDWAPSIVINGN